LVKNDEARDRVRRGGLREELQIEVIEDDHQDRHGPDEVQKEQTLRQKIHISIGFRARYHGWLRHLNSQS
jgi:hypothetical protein